MFLPANFQPTEQLSNSTARSHWVIEQVKYVLQHSLDGVNVDFEDKILTNQTDIQNGLTLLMKELYYKLKNINKKYQVCYYLNSYVFLDK
jgi:hypothetical protein